jgi:hypothetical protein
MVVLAFAMMSQPSGTLITKLEITVTDMFLMLATPSSTDHLSTAFDFLLEIEHNLHVTIYLEPYPSLMWRSDADIQFPVAQLRSLHVGLRGLGACGHYTQPTLRGDFQCFEGRILADSPWAGWRGPKNANMEVIPAMES